MASSQDIFTSLLKRHGQSLTKARQTVFDALSSGGQPLAMRDLVERCKGVDRASVYRAVEVFERLAIVQRIYTGWKYKLELSDHFTAHHHHLTCLTCGKSIAMSESELEQFIDAVAARHKFHAETHQIEIQGYCADCQGRMKN